LVNGSRLELRLHQARRLVSPRAPPSAPASGELWIHEMGPKGGDEINLIEKGKNYGWPIVSKGDHYDDTAIPRHASKPEFAPPAKSWNPSTRRRDLSSMTDPSRHGEATPLWAASHPRH
jgi:hypothetical protein